MTSIITFNKIEKQMNTLVFYNDKNGKREIGPRTQILCFKDDFGYNNFIIARALSRPNKRLWFIEQPYQRQRRDIRHDIYNEI